VIDRVNTLTVKPEQTNAFFRLIDQPTTAHQQLSRRPLIRPNGASCSNKNTSLMHCSIACSIAPSPSASTSIAAKSGTARVPASRRTAEQNRDKPSADLPRSSPLPDARTGLCRVRAAHGSLRVHPGRLRQEIIDEYREQFMPCERDESGSAPETSDFCALDDDEGPSI
jgi:hypothetical protein